MKAIALKEALDHKPQAADFGTIEIERPPCPPGGVLARVVYISLDPYVGSILRGRHMGEMPPVPMKEAIPGAIIAQVEESRSEQVQTGDHIFSMDGGWKEYAALPEGTFRVLPREEVPLSAYLGILGMPGLTAWAGVTQLAQISSGDTFLVDAAAGPVGGTAGQIARLKGAARVVGIAGGPEKCSIVMDRYGFDACIDYRRQGWRAALADALPTGLDVFFENVSADMAMTALSHANPYARGILCGLVDAYQDAQPNPHAINAGLIIGKRAKLMGLVVYDFYPKWEQFTEEMITWIRAGKITYEEDCAHGLDAAPEHFERLVNGQNRGKALVAIAPEAV